MEGQSNGWCPEVSAGGLVPAAVGLPSSYSHSRLVEAGVTEHIIISLDPMNNAIATVVNLLFPLFPFNSIEVSPIFQHNY